jgi:hypothetical protein
MRITQIALVVTVLTAGFLGYTNMATGYSTQLDFLKLVSAVARLVGRLSWWPLIGITSSL